MEIRVLQYFLEAAREGNMTRAAERLHVSQPTMSKQFKELEDELGKKLFTRSNYGIKLTDAGILLRERAEDIIELVKKTKADFQSLDDLNSGNIFVGAAESNSIKYFTTVLKDLQKEYPNICYHLYSGNMADVCEKLDKGMIDFGIVMSFVDLAKYTYLKLPVVDTWVAVMPKNAKLAQKEIVSMDELINYPLICSRQWMEQEMPHWYGEKVKDIHIVGTFNLFYNAALMVQSGMGIAITYDNLTNTDEHSKLTSRPIAGVPLSPMYIIWRKYQTFSPVANLLLMELKKRFAH